MGELRFARSPRTKRAPAPLLLTAGALVIAAVAFLLGRVSVGPTVPAVPRPVEPAAPLPTVHTAAAAAPAEPTIAFLRPSPVEAPASPPAPASNSQVFTLPTAAPVVPAEEPERAATPTQRAEMARCLSFSVSRDDSITMTYGVRVRIVARNSCGVAFAGPDAEFEVRAFPIGGGGLAARETGVFQSTIAARGSAETLVHVRCDADRAFRFEARIARP